MSSMIIKVQKVRSGSRRRGGFTRPHISQNLSFITARLRFGRLKDELRSSHERMVTVSHLSRSLSECAILPQFYDRLSSSVLALFPQADALYIYCVDQQHQSIRFIHAAQNNPALAAEVLPAVLPSNLLRGLPGEVMRAAAPLLIGDLPHYAALRGCSFPELAGGSPVKSLLLTPVMSRRVVYGVLELLSHKRRRFSPADNDLLFAIGNTAGLVLQNNQFKEDLDLANRTLAKTYENTIESWRRALGLRDQISEGHSTRSAEMAVRLGAWLGVDRNELVFVRFGAVLHDIGKIGIPDSVLFKPGPLEEEEMDLMRKHPQFAFDILSSLPNFAPVLEIPFYHHERWDGNGYPTGLEGEQIPLAARIFAVVDVWDALCSDRPYRQAWPEEEALTYIRQESGKHFDPRVVDAFMALV
jgi:hypothetical protein